jgi:hypothetical protein
MTDDCESDMDCFDRAREYLKKAAEKTNCGYCREFANTEADKVLKPFIGIKDNLALMDQMRSQNKALAQEAYEKSKEMVIKEASPNDTFTFREMFPFGFIPSRLETRPRFGRILNRDIAPNLTVRPRK